MTLIKGKICPPLPLSCILLVLFSLRGLTGSTYDPEFDFPLPNLTAKLGTDVSFTCVVKHLGEFKVAWIKSDDKAILAYHNHLVSHNHRYLITHNGHNTWTLHIKNVQQNDSGTYMVQIGTLEVVVPADIIDEETLSEVTVKEGESTVLKCKATGYPLPKVRWKRQDGQPLPLSRELLNPGEKLDVWEGETLPLRPLSRSDTGAFLCIANNSHPPLVSKRVMVYVNIPPLIKVSNQLVAAPAEINVTLECDVESVPKPFTSWGIKGGQIILTTEGKYVVTTEIVNDYRMRNKLTILNLRPQDFADYNCSARNTLGDATSTVKLQQIFPPMPPKTTSTTHHPNKHHSSSKSHEWPENSGKHNKNNNNNRGKQQIDYGGYQQSGGGSRIRNTANEDLSGEGYENGVDLTQQHATTIISNPNNILRNINSWRTTPTPWNTWSGSSSNSNGRNRGRNSAAVTVRVSMKLGLGLPLILTRLIPLLFSFLISSKFHVFYFKNI